MWNNRSLSIASISVYACVLYVFGDKVLLNFESHVVWFLFAKLSDTIETSQLEENG